MPLKPVVSEFLRALRQRRTYDVLHNHYLQFGLLWGASFPVLVAVWHWWTGGHSGLQALAAELARIAPTPGLAAYPLGLVVVFGAFGTIRAEKDLAVERTIASLQERVLNRTQDLHDAYVETVLALAQAIEAKDKYTAGHSWRVWEYARRAARVLGVGGQDLEDLAFACYLHDIGKIKIPGRILNKPGPLTDREQRIMELHPIYGAKIVAPIGRYARVAPLIRHHHERSDGTGYPDGLTDADLTLSARIMIVADAMDAMCSHRPYRAALGTGAALEELKRCSGLPFDAALVPGGRTESCRQFDARVVAALVEGLATEPVGAEQPTRRLDEDGVIQEYLESEEALETLAAYPGRAAGMRR